MPSPTYPPLTEPPPAIYGDNDFRRWEEALRQLAVAKARIEQCKRCNIPVQAAENDCDQLCAFYNGLIAEHQGPQRPIGG